MPSPTISLVIPAWNEQAYLPRLLDTVDVARARYRGGPDAVEVIVADNGSTDATAEIARRRGCRVAPVARRRIACARNGGAAVARGAILSFVDADMRIHPETFNAIDEAMDTGRYVGGATGVRVERMSPGIAVAVVAILPMLVLTGVDAGVWFCRRADFDEVGGYDESLPVTEDVRFLWALKRLGRRRRPRQKLARLSSWGSFWRTFRGLPADGPEQAPSRCSGSRPLRPADTAARPYQSEGWPGRAYGALETAPAEPAVDGVRAIVSFRKFDKHGDWHFLRDFVCMVFWLFFSSRRFNAHVQRYWYEDER